MTALYCCYCKRTLEPSTSKARTAMTRDHIVPRHLGGRRTVPCCRQCNQIKGPLHPDAWRRVTDAYPQWWTRFRDHGELVETMRSDAWREHRRRQWLGKWPRDVVVARPPMCRGLV